MFSHFLIWEGDMAAAGVTACGMFSPTHLIVTAVCFAVLAVCLHLSRGMKEEQLDKIVLDIAIPVTLLECCKILFNWVHGGMTPNHWLPLTYCSLSIYAYWMIACGNKKVHEMGKGFIVGGGIVGGFAFLILPMTSVATYPMFHFLSCYSMAFHTVMMYVGLSYLLNGYFHYNRRGYVQYLLFSVPACGLALAVNLIYGLFDDIANCNMMFISHPYRLGDVMPFVGAVYHFSPVLYTIGALAVYLSLPYFVPCGIVCLLKKCKRRHDAKAEEKRVADDFG